MKVLLVTPGCARTRERWMPLGLLYIASSLRAAGHIPRIHDRYLIRDAERDGALRLEIAAFRPDLIGFSTVSPLIYDTARAARVARGEFGGPIALGGHHATAMPGLTLERIPEADFALTGEGERALCLLADGKPPGEVPGLWRREGGAAVCSPGSARIDELDSLPPPDYARMDMAYYAEANPFTISNFLLRTAPILASRGCPHRCEFCTESLTYSGGVRFHSAPYVLDVAARLRRDHGVNGLVFYDNDFLIDRDRAAALCEGLVRSGLSRAMRFSIQARADRIDPEIAALLRRAGCVKAELGLETGREETLLKVGKGFAAVASERAVACLNRAGVAVQANMIMGLPGETVEDLNETLGWFSRLRVDNVKCTMLSVLPGSLMYCRLGGEFYERNEWTYENLRRYAQEPVPSSLPREARAGWYKKRYLPLSKRLERRGLLRRNSPAALLGYFVRRLARRAASLAPRRHEKND